MIAEWGPDKVDLLLIRSATGTVNEICMLRRFVIALIILLTAISSVETCLPVAHSYQVNRVDISVGLATTNGSVDLDVVHAHDGLHEFSKRADIYDPESAAAVINQFDVDAAMALTGMHVAPMHRPPIQVASFSKLSIFPAA